MELFSPWHLLVLAIVVAVLFFGCKQLPDMARSLGRSLRIFKTEIKGMTEDDKVRDAAAAHAGARCERHDTRRRPQHRSVTDAPSRRRRSTRSTRSPTPAANDGKPRRPDWLTAWTAAGDGRQSLRSTVTTRPRMVASSPSIGW